MSTINKEAKKKNRELNRSLLTKIEVKLAKCGLNKTDFCYEYNLPVKSFYAVFSGVKKSFNDAEFLAIAEFLRIDISYLKKKYGRSKR